MITSNEIYFEAGKLFKLLENKGVAYTAFSAEKWNLYDIARIANIISEYYPQLHYVIDNDKEEITIELSVNGDQTKC